MRVALVAVGSEMLGGGRRDTNGDWLLDLLERHGASVGVRAIVEDDARTLAALLGALASTHQAIVLSGGLGPTEDDRTREALSLALGRPLKRDRDLEGRLEAAYRSRGYRFGPEQARQADLPEGSSALENRFGSAPGIRSRLGETTLLALPGVPAELRGIAADVLPALLAGRTRAFARRTLKIAGRTESGVDAAVRDLYDAPGRRVTILASSGIVELLLRTEGPSFEEATESLESLEAALRERLGDDLFGRDEETLAAAVGASLAARGETVGTAESCTGGLLGGALTEIPGASRWYRGGVVAYADELKTRLAGVDPALLGEEGAVSASVARALSRGAREATGADWGIGITGIAGPGGGTDAKPVGLVHVAVTGPGGETELERRLPGDRALVRARTVSLALDLLRRALREP